jgi:hypothetical protein
VTARELSECISLSKEVYSEIIKNASADVTDNPNDKSAKSYSIRVLKKRRELRTQEELVAVATFLDRRNEFYRKLNRSNQIELAKVADLVTVKPNTRKLTHISYALSSCCLIFDAPSSLLCSPLLLKCFTSKGSSDKRFT